jgi:D-3-phosphoglycerate dehydrogenase
MKILFIDSNHSILHETLENAGHTCDLNYSWTKDQIIDHIHLYDGIVIRSKIKITKEIIDKAVKLKFIARAGAGMENIDVTYAENKGIKCLHAPEGNRDAVGEFALGMLLCLFNNICRANNEVREGKWIREGNRGVELMGKTVGIIGYGNMGSAFAERLKSFGAKVLVYDKYKNDFGNDFIIETSLKHIFEEADVISLHTPLTDETHYMINDEFINRFKKNIYIINTARGKCLNTTDLVKNIQSGKIFGACLDVLEKPS